MTDRRLSETSGFIIARCPTSNVEGERSVTSHQRAGRSLEDSTAEATLHDHAHTNQQPLESLHGHRVLLRAIYFNDAMVLESMRVARTTSSNDPFVGWAVGTLAQIYQAWGAPRGCTALLAFTR